MTRTHLRYLLATSLALAITVPAVAIGAGEGQPIDGGQRNPSPDGTQEYTQETEIIAETSTYGTRQSNKRDGDGGGAIYGCRSNPGAEPCIRSNNLKGGRAFEFVTSGKEAGMIATGDANGAPFTTTATGVATGLNADRVDGKDGADLAAAGDLKFAAVSAAGTLGAKRGATASTLQNATGRTFVVTFDRDVDSCSYTATQSGAEASDQSFAVTGGSDKKTVIVDQRDDAPAVPFHLQVVC